MNDAPVLPVIAEKKELKPKTVAPTKKPALKKSIGKHATTKPHPQIRKSAKKPAKKSTAKISTRRNSQRKPFPYARVLKMWKAGKSSMEIAKTVGRYDSKAADPMHSFRVTLTRFHKGVRINGKVVKLPHRVSKAALKRATKAGKKAAA